jgi:tRNA(Ile)-lysidine synthase
MSLVESSISDFAWRNHRLLVACSGGVDSMTLLHALVRSGKRPEVLHVNYQLRGIDSEADMQLVMEFSRKLGLECRVHRCPTALLKGKGVNLQSAARDFRRKLFLEWTNASPENAVVLAHHLDDQSETFFLQLFRGAGTFGLGAMHPDKNGLLRPFLDIPKKAITEYAMQNGVPWREDKSNAESVYLRNLFRNELLPRLGSDVPDLFRSVACLTAAFRQTQQELEEQILPLADTWKASGRLEISIWLQLGDEEKLALLKAIKGPEWLLARLGELALRDNGKKAVFGQNAIVRHNEHLLLTSAAGKAWDFKVEEVEILPEKFDPYVLYLDGALVDAAQICLDEWKTGEKITSLGMRGKQLVSKVLKDAGVSQAERKSYPVVRYKGDILWVPGIKIAKGPLAQKTSASIIRVTVFSTSTKETDGRI